MWVKNCIRQRSLRTLLLVPFILQIAITVGIIGVVTFRKGKNAVQVLAEQYGTEICTRIHRELQTSLDLPYHINAATADALRLGLLSLDNPDQLEQHFWTQLHRFESVSYIFVGNEEGGTRGVGRTQNSKNGEHQFWSYETIDHEHNRFQRGAYHLYRSDRAGVRRPRPDSITVGFDATVRPWYQVVAYQAQPAWSDVYLYFAENVLGISASHPIYKADGTFQGVLATDIRLDQLKDFLDTLTIGKTGDAFIVERNGTMVASSTPERPFKLTDTETNTQERLLALDSQEPLIAHSTQVLINQFGALNQVKASETGASQPFQLMIDNQRYFMEVLPFNHGQHLDWLIVVIIPESDFMDEIRAASQQILVTGGGALAIALIFGIGVLRWVTLPLKRLSAVSQAFAQGDFSQRIHLNRCDDIGILAQSFNQMANQLENLFNHLQDQVHERTIHLEAAKQDAETANQAKSQFLANMSHELRTPLNGILGYAQVLQRDRDIAPKHQRGLQVIQQCGIHLLALINEVLDLSKIEAQKMNLHPQSFAFRTFLQSIADLFQLRAEEKGISFVYNPDPRLPMAIEGDEQKLRQILINLLGNAIKFTRHGHVTLTVSVLTTEGLGDVRDVGDVGGPREAGGAAATQNLGYRSVTPDVQSSILNPQRLIRFHIQDTGPGIALEDIEAVFQPFQQVGDRSTQDGTGLGLAISYQLVQLMGGTLSLQSEVGQGSCFWFDLMVEDVLNGFIVQSRGDRPSTQRIVGFDGPAQRILVIDDIEANRLFLVDLLSSIGFEVAEAENGQDGLDMLQSFCPHAILMDLVMPVLDGVKTTQLIRHNPKWSAFQSIPIIAISASTLHQGKAQSLGVGCNAFLLKPLDASELLQLLQTHLHLQWQYASDSFPQQQISPPLGDRIDPPPLAPPLHHSTTPSLHHSIIPPPSPILEKLCQCAEIGDISGISDILIQLNEPHLAPFVEELQTLTAQFQIKKIQSFLGNFSIRNQSVRNQ